MSEHSIDISAKEEDYVCPITHEVPKDPVVASDGYTYERVAIEAWLLRGEVDDKYTSPITREDIEQKVYPNRLARALQSSDKEEKSTKEVHPRHASIPHYGPE